MPFSRFLQLKRLLVEAKQEESKEKLILAAFVGWQMGAGGGNKKFGEYLGELGLSDGLGKPAQEANPQNVVDDTAALKRMGIEVKKVKAGDK